MSTPPVNTLTGGVENYVGGVKKFRGASPPPPQAKKAGVERAVEAVEQPVHALVFNYCFKLLYIALSEKKCLINHVRIKCY